MRNILAFTLTEAMIVVTIIAILASIGYPAYQEQLRESRRQEAIQGLLDLQRQVEELISLSSTNSLPTSGSVTIPSLSFYNLSYTNNTTYYTLTATAIASESQDDDTGCTTFTLQSFASTVQPVSCL